MKAFVLLSSLLLYAFSLSLSSPLKAATFWEGDGVYTFDQNSDISSKASSRIPPPSISGEALSVNCSAVLTAPSICMAETLHGVSYWTILVH